MKRTIDRPLILPRIGPDDETLVEAQFDLSFDAQGDVVLSINGESVLGFRREQGGDGRMALWLRKRKTDDITCILDSQGQIGILGEKGEQVERLVPSYQEDLEDMLAEPGDPDCGCAECDDQRAEYADAQAAEAKDCAYFGCPDPDCQVCF